MNRSQRTSLTLGVILVVLGALFIAANMVPPLRYLLNEANTWPMIIEVVAAALLILGLAINVPDMAVPAVIVAGIGGILWWQNSTGDWASWGYMWALIPAFSGLGMLLAKVLGGNERYNAGHALSSIASGLVLFVIFGALFNGFTWMGPYWPVLLIAAGLLMAFRSFFRK